MSDFDQFGTFLAEIEGKDVVRVHSLRKGAAEAIEAVAQNSKSGKPSCIGKELGEILSLPLNGLRGKSKSCISRVCLLKT